MTAKIQLPPYMLSSGSIPVLDLSPLAQLDFQAGQQSEFSSETDSVKVLAGEFFETYSTIGFGYVINHGIDQKLVDEVFSASIAFHDLPEPVKLEIALNQNHRGFIPINTSTDVNSKLAQVTRPNQSESFIMLRDDQDDSADVLSGNYLAGKNIWPDLPGFKETLTRYSTEMESLARKLVHIAALSLKEDPRSLLMNFSPPTTWLRLLHYPVAPPQRPADLYGSAPHTDFGCLTILAQDKVGGLQVKDPLTNNWINVPQILDSFVVNVGDMLHRWSNGLLISTPHQVINPTGNERYSCPFFYDPHVSTEINPLPNCVKTVGKTLFEPINFGEFLKTELEASYDQHKFTAN